MKLHLPNVNLALRLLLLAAVAAVSCMCGAQNNQYKINDELFDIYVDAYRDRTTLKGLQLSTRMYNRAIQLGDTKAQCLAYTLPVSYYFFHNEQKRLFFRAVKRLQDMAFKLGHTQYYYFGFSNKVNFLLNLNLRDEALEYIHETEVFARRNNDNYGIYSCLCAHGQLFIASREIYSAIQYFNEALNMAQKVLPNIEISNLYRKMAECYSEIYDYDHMLDYGLMAFKNSNTVIARQRTVRAVCYAALMLDNSALFERYYDAYREMKGHVNPDSRDNEERDIAILKMLHDRDLDKAYTYILKLKHRLPRYRLMAKYYSLKGDYRALAALNEDMYHFQVCDFDSVRSHTYDGTLARFQNLRLDIQNQQLSSQRQHLDNERKSTELKAARLKLTNTQLTLKNSSLELSRTRSESDLLRLSYRKKQLETDKLRGELNTSKLNQEFNDMLAMLGAMCGTVIMLGIGVYLWSRSHLMMDLKETNDVLARNHTMLTRAKEHAEAASRVKSTFIQNMGNEIRQPLTELITLANTVASDNGKMSKQELSELNRQIAASTGELLGIVDSVLKKV